METKKRYGRGKNMRFTSRIPEKSTFYNKILPVILVILGVIMLLLILFAVAVLIGWIRF